jgi:ribosomal-protein-alanine N-acetyltransferase
MNYNFKRVTNNDVQDILTWKYEGAYSLYDNDIVQGKIDWVKGLPEDVNTFSGYNDKGELVGHCQVYINKEVTFSVQIRPSLTGKGMGGEFILAFLDFAKEKYALKSIRLLVAKFNERAFKAYLNVGFTKIEEIVGKSIRGDMEFIVMEKQF